MNTYILFALVTAATMCVLGLITLMSQSTGTSTTMEMDTNPSVYVIAEEDFKELNQKVVDSRVVEEIRQRSKGEERVRRRPPSRKDKKGNEPAKGAPKPKNKFVPNDPGFFEPIIYREESYDRPENVPPKKILKTSKSFEETNGESRIMKSTGKTCSHPKEQDTAIVFVHVFKTGGTTVRNVLMSFSQSCGLNYFLGGQGIMCDQYEEQCGSPCNDPTAIPPPCQLQKDWMLGQDVMSGHFFYGTHLFYPKTFYITQLRHPFTAFVSARMYVPQKRGHAVQSIKEGIELLEEFFATNQYRKGGVPYRIDFHMRLTAHEPTSEDDMEEMTQNVLNNLENFGVVGLTEHWNVTLRLMQATLDREDHLHFWDHYEEYVSNSAGQPFGTTELVNALPPALVAKIEEYTKYESIIFYRARDIMYEQCMQFLDPAGCECISIKDKHYSAQKEGIKIGQGYAWKPNPKFPSIAGPRS